MSYSSYSRDMTAVVYACACEMRGSRKYGMGTAVHPGLQGIRDQGHRCESHHLTHDFGLNPFHTHTHTLTERLSFIDQ